MNIQLLGSILIIVGSGGVGFFMALHEKRELESLRQFIKSLEFMGSSLGYRLSPLPELFRTAAGQASGTVKRLLMTMAGELEQQVFPNASYCMNAALERVPDLPRRTAIVAREFGDALGCFDVEGQLKGIDAAICQCNRLCRELEENRPQRLRSYQTLGLCAGAALVILLL